MLSYFNTNLKFLSKSNISITSGKSLFRFTKRNLLIINDFPENENNKKSKFKIKV